MHLLVVDARREGREPRAARPTGPARPPAIVLGASLSREYGQAARCRRLHGAAKRRASRDRRATGLTLGGEAAAAVGASQSRGHDAAGPAARAAQRRPDRSACARSDSPKRQRVARLGLLPPARPRLRGSRRLAVGGSVRSTDGHTSRPGRRPHAPGARSHVDARPRARLGGSPAHQRRTADAWRSARAGRARRRRRPRGVACAACAGVPPRLRHR